MPEAVELDRLSVRFGGFTAVDEVSLRIEPGEFFSFLGPSGCGKTTLLRAVSGFVAPSAGRVLIGGRDMSGIGPHKRPTALIFQNLALFPMMTVAENVAYGLRVRGVARAERARVAARLLETVALTDQGDKPVDALSGGQRQRVAIARALAVEPQVLLLDEPLSALDLKLRQHMRNELRAIQRRVGITFIYITHDQGEALTMSDRIGVMNAGRIEQVGDGRGVYAEPRTEFVAGFVGETNALRGVIADARDGLARLRTALGVLQARNPLGLAAGEEAILFVRPECLVPGLEAVNRIEATAAEIAYEGYLTHVALVAAGLRLSVVVNAGQPGAPDVEGAAVSLGFHAEQAMVLRPGVR